MALQSRTSPSTKVDYKNIEQLELEFEEVVKSFYSHHANMEMYTGYRNNNVFYAPKNGSLANQSSLSMNLLKVFADKNTHYTSEVPDMVVTPTEANDFERNSASKREKAVHATLQGSGAHLLQRKWAEDATVRGNAIAVTTWDTKKRCPVVERLDPRYCYWQYANDNDEKIVAFWVAYPMTKDQIQRQYGVTPTHSFVDPASFTKQTLSRVDGKDWYMVVKRYDDEVCVSWVGDKFIQEPYNHQLGAVPVDISSPLSTGELDKLADFYLRPLISPQAEYNETMRKMANIVRKLGNPAVWGRGIVARQHEDVKRALRGDGGFVGLKGDGELGILQVPETKMLQDHLDNIMSTMKYLSGFSGTAFGEAVGANTSGDAIAMYSAPQQRSIGFQNIAWKSFYESISAKILRYYYENLRVDEQKELLGYATMGTFMGTKKSTSYKSSDYTRGSFATKISKEDIAGNFVVEAIPKQITPKDEIAYKRLIMEASTNGFISKTTGYEEWGMKSPQDELELLKVELGSDQLNPEGELQRAQATSTMAGAVNDGTQSNMESGSQNATKGNNNTKATKASSKTSTT